MAFENPFYASSSREQGNTTVRSILTMMMMMTMITIMISYDDYVWNDSYNNINEVCGIIIEIPFSLACLYFCLFIHLVLKTSFVSDCR